VLVDDEESSSVLLERIMAWDEGTGMVMVADGRIYCGGVVTVVVVVVVSLLKTFVFNTSGL
jgi:hypothetical protein